MIVIYLILGGIIIYLANKEQKPYKLFFVPLLFLSYFGTTKIYGDLSSVTQRILLAISLILGAAILALYYRDFKETKRNFLKVRRFEREAMRRLKEQEPERTKHVTVKNMRTGEERAYLVRPPKETREFQGKK